MQCKSKGFQIDHSLIWKINIKQKYKANFHLWFDQKDEV